MDACSPGKIDRIGELGRPHVHSLAGSLKSLWEWSGSSLGTEHNLAGFQGGEVWTVATPRRRGLGCKVSPKHFRMDPRGLDEASYQTVLIPEVSFVLRMKQCCFHIQQSCPTMFLDLLCFLI